MNEYFISLPYLHCYARSVYTIYSIVPVVFAVGAVVVYLLEYWPVVHDVAGSIPANLMDGEWKTVSAESCGVNAFFRISPGHRWAL